jgi:hypothetical protein
MADGVVAREQARDSDDASRFLAPAAGFDYMTTTASRVPSKLDLLKTKSSDEEAAHEVYRL